MTTHTSIVELVIPEAPVPTASNDSSSLFAWRSNTDGLHLGVLDNSKGNADHLLRLLTDGLRAEFPIKSVLSLRKLNPSTGAPAEILNQLAEEADLVVSAMAD